MVQYATASELAGLLQKDLDTYSADQVLQLASALFSRRARTWWAASTATYTTAGVGVTRIDLPYRPVTAVTAVRVNGVVQPVDYTLRRHYVYRDLGFGDAWSSPPDEVQIDYTHGYTSVPDDVKGAVLEMAAQAYEVPVGAVVSESIDDYAVRYATTGGGMQLTSSAAALAAGYRGVLIA
jgi:hypothetical protein